ncbi:MAG TPA: site-specific DNA-methyltransferase [Anaerovoracaceae bacterium]|nr:site-specific DNA-methyltransferase [Anaerovoracaceae bacterium]
MGRKNRHPNAYYQANYGQLVLGDSLTVLSGCRSNSVDLIVTSPPYGLVRKKKYGNVDADQYCEWFKAYGREFHRVLKDSGSLVIDIGGAWNKGFPTRSLYHFKLLIMLCEELNFHLAQEFYWWNPAKLPSPAEWVTIRRIRVKDAVDTVWWLSKTPWPKASNKRVLQPYSDRMINLLQKGGKDNQIRPSGHNVNDESLVNHGASIPPNMIAIPNTDSQGSYLQFCRESKLAIHPARFPAELPEFFIRMLTDPGDLVIDPFAGSGVTGEVCERLERNWRCIELNEEYLQGAVSRFACGSKSTPENKADESRYYRIPRPGSPWYPDAEKLKPDGGIHRTRPSGEKG